MDLIIRDAEGVVPYRDCAKANVEDGACDIPRTGKPRPYVIFGTLTSTVPYGDCVIGAEKFLALP